MKPTREWDEQYILNLPPGEHDWVEFKSARALDFSLAGVDENKVLGELSKQLSAFANSSGGNLVYGIENTPAGGLRQVDSNGGVSIDLKGGTKEWLEDVIPNLVEFPLTRFNVYSVENKDASSTLLSGRAIFIVNILESETAPHQALDKRYYARVSGKSRPIGHRMVLDIVGRAKHPKMKLECTVEPKGLFSGERRKDVPSLLLYCRNVGRVYANYVSVSILIPKGIVAPEEGRPGFGEGGEYVEIQLLNLREEAVGFTNRPLYLTRYEPVLPNLGFSRRIALVIALSELGTFEDKTIRWTIQADNAPEQCGEILIAEIRT